MKKKILLSLALVAILTVLFAISVSAAGPVQTWKISKTDSDYVTAYLYDNPEKAGYYDLVINGSGEMKDWTSTSKSPWNAYIKKIVNVEMGRAITNIGNYAFYGPSGIKNVIIGTAVKSIGSHAFSNNDSLGVVNIPDSVVSIGDYAFSDCDGQTTVIIPKSVTAVGEYAFAWSEEYLTIYAEASYVPSGWISRWNWSDCKVVWGHTHFYVDYACSCGNLAYVKKMDVSKTENDNVWAYLFYDGTVIVSGNGEMCDGRVFGDEHSISVTNLIIEHGVTSIGEYAFGGQQSLESVSLPDTLKVIGIEAFTGCYALSDIEFPEGLEVIGDDAFSACQSLNNLKFPSTLKYIGDCAFYWCHMYGTLFIPKSVEYIGNGAFKDNGGFTTIYLEAEDYYYLEYDNAFDVWDRLTVVLGHKHLCNSESGLCECGVSIGNQEHVMGVWETYGKDAIIRKCQKCSYSEKRGENVSLANIFEFKGYSVNLTTGRLSVGFTINYSNIEAYENATGESLDFGIVFASFELLGGLSPLDENGNATALSVGRVIKSSLKGFAYENYDFILMDLDESLFDHSFVISAYSYGKDGVKYYQANGISDTVTGVSYNEAVGVTK